MSSHREAPEISKDPVADSTDVYAFVSPDRPGWVTMIANYIPLQDPNGGPNFFEFGDDVLYEIHISNAGKGQADVTYGFKFRTVVENPNTFLYNTGPITHLQDPTFNRRQYYTVTKTVLGHAPVTLKTDVPCPPVNIGPRSTPNYAALANACIAPMGGGRQVFAGQRADGFHVDLGSVFDLLDLREFSALHLIPGAAATTGINSLAGKNVHSIAIQVPFSDITKGGITPTNAALSTSVVGVWTTASRQRSTFVEDGGATNTSFGPWVQVSRLGNPLVNEALIPMGKKDTWNHAAPSGDSAYVASFAHPEISGLLPVLYPTAFPNLKKYTKARADIEAILLTGIPSGIVPGFQNNTGTVMADMLRLNLAIPATAPAKASPAGLVGGDAAGFPNGRRVIDDVVTIELRALAGVTIPLVDKTFTPDAAAAKVTDGSPMPPYLSKFPYLNTPHDGFDVPQSVYVAS
jgi:hypothetical protein